MNKLKEIRKILKKCERDFIPIKLYKGKYVDERDLNKYSKKEVDRIEKNFLLYSEALAKIYRIIK